MAPPPEQRDIRLVSTHLLRDRLELLDATIAAVDQYVAVTAAITGAHDRTAARAAVRTLLRVGESQARAVMDLRWEELNATAREAVHKERDKLAAELSTRPLH